jgi:hypothetical protein
MDAMPPIWASIRDRIPPLDHRTEASIEMSAIEVVRLLCRALHCRAGFAQELAWMLNPATPFTSEHKRENGPATFRIASFFDQTSRPGFIYGTSSPPSSLGLGSRSSSLRIAVLLGNQPTQ